MSRFHYNRVRDPLPVSWHWWRSPGDWAVDASFGDLTLAQWRRISSRNKVSR